MSADLSLDVSIFSIAIAISSIISVTVFNLRSKTETRSANIVKLYLDALKIGMENPKFRNPKYTCNYKEEFNEDELPKYEVYANIVWNICETISEQKNKKLVKQWRPVLAVENELHREWFEAKENCNKFQIPFRKYVTKEFPVHLKALKSNLPKTT
jgi:hypothetical protein